jgi:hypothetical protein
MNLQSGRVDVIAAFALVLALGYTATARAGGLMEDEHDDVAKAAGPSYFGFVKDNRGAIVPDAKVAADLKGSSVVTRSDVTGAYKLPGFGKEVSPDDVVISCGKEGFKQLRVLRRTANAATATAIEIECTLQRL